jgi:hypothetical protein
MAILNTFPLGEIRGKIGNIIVRRIYGKSIISVNPHYRTKSNDPETLARRKKFRMSVKLANCINKIPELRFLWYKSAKRKMSAHNAAMKANYDKVSDECVVGIPLLFPDSYVMDYPGNIMYDENGVLRIEFNKNKYSFNLEKERFVKAVAVLSLSKPFKSYEESTLFFNTESEYYDLTKNNTIEINLCNIISQTMKEYNVKKFFFAFITANTHAEIIRGICTYNHNIL